MDNIPNDNIIMFYDGCSNEIYFSVDSKNLKLNDNVEFKPFIANFEKKCDIIYDNTTLQCGNEIIYVHQIDKVCIDQWKKLYYTVYLRKLLNASKVQTTPYITS